MEAIGGYFELELRNGEHFHNSAIRLNTARNCFEYILRARGYKKVYIPYYTCEVMLEPLKKCSVAYEYYHINKEFEPADYILIKDGEALLYTNYFGLKQNCIKRLASLYGNNLIVDNAQAFYAKPIEGIDTFYSARKFFGVADGAYLYTNCPLDILLEQDQSYQRMSHLLKRADIGAELGYQDFKNNDNSLINNPIKKMSNLTEDILRSIDYEEIKNKRRDNYLVLAEALNATNKLHFSLQGDDIPMVYPFLSERTKLKQQLIEQKIYIATYWPNVLEWCKNDDWEYKIASNCCYLPVDQRVNIEMINHIINLI